MAHNDSFDEPRFEALYRKLYPDLLRCAEIALRTGGSWYVSVAGRAEEVVQELFAFAWEHQADLWSSASPTGWLYRVLRYKVLELLKEDRFWRKHLIRAAGEMPASPEDDFQQRAEITSILTPEEYEILRKLYLEKYTLRGAGAGDGVEEVRPGHAGQAFKGAVRQTVEPALKVFPPPL
ncbi:MAG: RNA polymerase sigma factor [Dysosmobacter sp.]